MEISGEFQLVIIHVQPHGQQAFVQRTDPPIVHVTDANQLRIPFYYVRHGLRVSAGQFVYVKARQVSVLSGFYQIDNVAAVQAHTGVHVQRVQVGSALQQTPQ